MARSVCPQPSVSVQCSTVVPVTKANYSEAETQTVFAKYITDVATATCTGSLGTILNLQKAADPKDRMVIRINFDTLYSWLIPDLTTPATFTLPQTNGRYQSAMVVNGQGMCTWKKNLVTTPLQRTRWVVGMPWWHSVPV